MLLPKDIIPSLEKPLKTKKEYLTEFFDYLTMKKNPYIFSAGRGQAINFFGTEWATVGTASVLSFNSGGGSGDIFNYKPYEGIK